MTRSRNDGRERQQTPPRYYGKYAGLVVDNGPPARGAHRGQLKVQVPGLLEDKPDGSGGHQPIEVVAAPSFLPGFFFLPEKGAQVWVEFVAGDINCPIWTGVWYPDDGAPQTADGKAPSAHERVIRTPSGQVITLDDTDGGQKTVIKDEKNGNTITLDQSGITVEVTGQGGSITLKVGPTTELKLAADGATLTDVTGSAQGVVLRPLYDWVTTTLMPWLLAHQHVGNMGAPTPLLPAPLAAPAPTSVVSHS